MHNTSQTMTYPSNIPIHFSIIKILQVHLAAHCQAQHIYIYNLFPNPSTSPFQSLPQGSIQKPPPNPPPSLASNPLIP